MRGAVGERGFMMFDGIRSLVTLAVLKGSGNKKGASYFSVVDVVGTLTEQIDYEKARKYWNKLKQRLKEEGSQLVTNCHQLKMTVQDGKKRLTDVANTEQLL